jgi:hypothetical protein
MSIKNRFMLILRGRSIGLKGSLAGLIILQIGLTQVAGDLIEQFDSQAGWKHEGDGSITFESDGGNPGGYLRMNFVGGPDPLQGRFVADQDANGPFTGNIWDITSADAQRIFAFDFRADTSLPLVLSVSFFGDSETWSIPVPTGAFVVGEWERVSLQLSYLPSGSPRWQPSQSANDSGAAFIASLSDVERFHIQVDSAVFFQPASYSIDNVTLIPEPQTMALLILGMAAAYRRRMRVSGLRMGSTSCLD